MPASRLSRPADSPAPDRAETGAPSLAPAAAAADDAASRVTADDWWEESNRQAAELKRAPLDGPSLFAEFRRKLAAGEALARAVLRLAMALRFTGRISVTFHQGRVTRTICEESYFSGGDS